MRLLTFLSSAVSAASRSLAAENRVISRRIGSLASDIAGLVKNSADARREIAAARHGEHRLTHAAGLTHGDVHQQRRVCDRILPLHHGLVARAFGLETQTPPRE